MIKILLTINILFASLFGHQVKSEYATSRDEHSARSALVAIAKAEIGVRELTGKNDGSRVEAYLSAVKLKKGEPWCAAFISWVFVRAGYAGPRTGWSPALFHSNVSTKAILPGNVLGIWFPGLGRIAHVGMVEQRKGDWVLSIEGNTNAAGSRDGDGVYRKRRHISTIYSYANWLPKERSKI